MSKHNNKQPIPQTPANTPQAQGVTWDHLETMYRECVAHCVIPGGLVPLLRNAELIGRLSDPEGFLNLAKILDRDFKTFIQKLNIIHERHAGRTGLMNPESNDLVHIIAINEDYMAWIESYHSIVTPIVTQMMDLGQIALEVPYEDTTRGKLEKAMREKREAVQKLVDAADVLEGKTVDLNESTTFSSEVLNVALAPELDDDEEEEVVIP